MKTIKGRSNETQVMDMMKDKENKTGNTRHGDVDMWPRYCSLFSLALFYLIYE